MNRNIVMAITGASGAVYAVRLLDVLLGAGCDVHLSISLSARVVLEQELGIAVDLDRFDPAMLKLGCHSLATEKRNDPRRADIPVCHDAPSPDLRRADIPVCQDGTSSDPRRADIPVCHDTSSPGRQECLPSGVEKISPGQLRYHHYLDFSAPIASGSFPTDGMVVCPCSCRTLSAIARGASDNLIHRAADVHLKERRRLVLVHRETPLSLPQIENLRLAAQAGAVILPASPGFYHGATTVADLVDFIVSRICDQLGVANGLISRWKESS
jgi:4-hydroxy-3-polyprenylbenzoate decarboxylase